VKLKLAYPERSVIVEVVEEEEAEVEEEEEQVGGNLRGGMGQRRQPWRRFLWGWAVCLMMPNSCLYLSLSRQSLTELFILFPLYVSGFQLYGSTEEHDPTGANDW